MNESAKLVSFFTALLMGVTGSWVGAHNFWIEPSSFRPAASSPVSVRLLVGEAFRGDAFPRTPSHIKKFAVLGPTGTAPVVGLAGSDPAGYWRPEQPGLYIITYGSTPSPITMEPRKFHDYLEQEGLGRINRLRAERGESGRTAREIFSRCAKSLVAVGPPKPGARDRKLDLTLELVAETNPYGLPRGQPLPLRLFYQGRPLEGALVVAHNRQAPSETLSSRSDQMGRVVFQLPRKGVWMVKAVHMVPAPAESGADWASFWASLTFELP
ncbi:MAG: DUF4198 domain-containing protein [Acidobacteriota bacterium]